MTSRPSSPPDETLRRQLLELRRRDEETRARLAADGSLFDGYAPEMERVHVENAARLEAIIDARGWPGIETVGLDGSTAAWLVAQHAISRPSLQRVCLARLREAVAAGDAAPEHLAYLTDRVRFNERRPQVYGTIFDWGDDGALSPWPIEDGGDRRLVDARRAEVGLPPLNEALARVRARAVADGEPAPADPRARRRSIDAWARRTGWIDGDDRRADAHEPGVTEG